VSDLRVELLYTLECPHWERVRADLHRVLSEGTIETPIQLVLVNDQDDAEFLGFVGSPSVRLNGTDVVPPPADTPANTGCRVYVQPDGSLSGRIPEGLLREAIRSHRQGRLEEFQRDESRKVAAAALEAAEDERLAGPGDVPDTDGGTQR
jgi:hypothetical protein